MNRHGAHHRPTWYQELSPSSPLTGSIPQVRGRAERELHSVSIVLMVASEVYNPEQWNDFFILVGTGAATLAGLVFVAMTINLKGVAKDATHHGSDEAEKA